MVRSSGEEQAVSWLSSRTGTWAGFSVWLDPRREVGHRSGWLRAASAGSPPLMLPRSPGMLCSWNDETLISKGLTMNSDDLKLSRRIQNLVPLPVMLTLALLVLVPASAGAVHFAKGDTVRVDALDGINVHRNASQDNVLGRQPHNSLGTVVDGPVFNSDENGVTGRSVVLKEPHPSPIGLFRFDRWVLAR